MSARIVEGASGLAADVVPQAYGVAFAVAVGEDGKLVLGCQPGALDEASHHRGRHVAINGVDDAYLVGLQVVVVLLHKLGDAQQAGVLVGQLACHVEAVACGGEVEQQAAGYPLVLAGGQRGGHAQGGGSGHEQPHALEGRAAGDGLCGFFLHRCCCVVACVMQR